MVLQRNVEGSPGGAAIWGYATEAGDTVTIDIDGEQYQTTADIGKQ